MNKSEGNAVKNETVKIAVGEAVCVLLMLGVYALIGHFSVKVLCGSVFGGIVTVLNFFFMALTVDRAADKYGDSVKQIKKSIGASYIFRLIVVLGVLALAIVSGYCDVLATLLPLVFVRPILLVEEYLLKSKKAKDKNTVENNISLSDFDASTEDNSIGDDGKSTAVGKDK